MMGVPYTTNATTLASFPSEGQTIAPGVYDVIRATQEDANEPASTPAECATIVRRYHPSANAALYSNVGELDSCRAVHDA